MSWNTKSLLEDFCSPLVCKARGLASRLLSLVDGARSGTFHAARGPYLGRSVILPKDPSRVPIRDPFRIGNSLAVTLETESILYGYMSPWASTHCRGSK